MSGYFTELPDGIRLPFTYAEFDPSQADRSISQMAFNSLVTGQMLSGEAAPYDPKRITTGEQADRYFGRGSMLAEMCKASLAANFYTKLTAIGVPDYSGGVAASGKVTFALPGETVTVPTPICLYIGGKLVRIPVSAGQGGQLISERAAAAVNGDGTLPVTAAVDAAGEDPITYSVILTAKHKGACGNDISIEPGVFGEDYPGGITFSSAAMAGGAGNPDPLETINAWGGTRYHTIAWPWQTTADLDALKSELDSRWGPLRQIDGQAFTVKTGGYSEVLDFTEARNDKHLTVFPSMGSPTLPWVDAAATAAVIAFSAEDDPARPLQTLTVPGVIAPREKDRWTDFPEGNQALYSGCSVRGVNPDGQVMLKSVITTHRFNSWGAETEAYLFIEGLFTISYLRYDLNNTIQRKYPRFKLGSDSEGVTYSPGQKVMAPKLMAAEVIAMFGAWQRRGLIELPSNYKSNIVVERNDANVNRLDIIIQPDLINQFRVCGTLIQFLL